MQNKCAHSNEEIHQIRESTAVNSGNSDTKSKKVCIISIKGIYYILSVAILSFDLGSLCWITLKEDMSKYQLVTAYMSIKASNALKASKVVYLWE